MEDFQFLRFLRSASLHSALLGVQLALHNAVNH